jgi:hypothetical protein
LEIAVVVASGSGYVSGGEVGAAVSGGEVSAMIVSRAELVIGAGSRRT